MIELVCVTAGKNSKTRKKLMEWYLMEDKMLPLNKDIDEQLHSIYLDKMQEESQVFEDEAINFLIENDYFVGGLCDGDIANCYFDR